MKTILSALAAVALLSSIASAAEASKTKEGWARGHSAHRVSGTAAHHSAAVHPANAIAGGQGFSSPNYASSNLPAYGGSLGSGPKGATVRPLRAVPRSRTSGAGAFVPGGPVQGRGYSTESAAPAKSTAGGGGTAIAGKGRALGGPGVTKGEADTPPGGAAADASGNDPLSKIMAGLGSMFGDMAKSMSAMWGTGG